MAALAVEGLLELFLLCLTLRQAQGETKLNLYKNAHINTKQREAKSDSRKRGPAYWRGNAQKTLL